MRVALISDADFARRERAMLRRLEVGLADEGARLARVAPPIEFDLTAVPSTEQISHPPRSNLMTTGSRARRVLANLRSRRFITERDPLDVVHGWGEGCWPLAIEIGRQTQTPVVLELWAARLVPRLRAMERRAARGKDSTRLLWLCPGQAIAELARPNAAAPIRQTPWGVHVPNETPRAWSDTQRPASIVITSSGAEPQAACDVLEALAQIKDDAGPVMIFLDEAAVQTDARVWRTVRSLGLLDRLSVIADMEGRRNLILRTDMLIHPEARGEHRSIVMDAMSAAMTVVARRDPHIDALIDGQTARLVERSGAEAWRDALQPLLTDRESARRIGAAAREHVRENRRVSAHVAAVMEAYQSLARGGAATSSIAEVR